MGQFTQPSANRIYNRRFVTINSDGSMTVGITVTNDAGKILETFSVFIPSAGAIIDEDQQILAANVPVGLNNARSSFLTALDNAIDAAAAAGKFNR